MLSFKRSVFALFALSLSVSAAAADPSSIDKIKQAGVLKVGIEPGFLPFEMRTPQGQWVGFDIDMMNAFATSLGVKVEYVSTKWDGIIPGLMAGKYDAIVSGMTITPERAKSVAFSDPYYDAGLKVLLALKNVATVKSVKDLDQKGKIIVLKLGTTGDLYATKNFHAAELRRMDTEPDAAQSVTLGKADAFIYDKPFVDIYAASHPGKVAVLTDVVSKESFGVAVQPKHKATVEAFNAFLANWKKTGGYDRAYKAEFTDLAWKKNFPEGVN